MSMTPTKSKEKKVSAYALVGVNTGEVYETWPFDKFGEACAKLRQTSYFSFTDRKVELVAATIIYKLPPTK